MWLSKTKGMWRRAARLVRSLGAAAAIALVAAPAYRGEALAKDLEVPTSWATNPVVQEALAADALEAVVGPEGTSARGGLWLGLTDLEHTGHSIDW
jgi:hypothetical protein